MEESTQSLLQKAKERREMLARKCGIVPTARDTSPTKPLSENNSNIPQSVADDSNNAKASLKDRLHSLQETYQHYETDLSPKKMKTAVSPAKPPRTMPAAAGYSSPSKVSTTVPSKSSDPVTPAKTLRTAVLSPPKLSNKSESATAAALTKSVTSPVKPTAAAVVSSKVTTSVIKPASISSPIKTSVAGPVAAPSPSKKMTIQERVQALQQNFKLDSSTTGAEAIRKQRDEEMAAVRNRWKNGILNDESAESNSTPPVAKETTPKKTEAPVSASSAGPPPPPPLPQATACKPAAPVTPAASAGPAKPPQQTEKFKRREEVRDRLREDFEQKLLAVGFEVESTTKGERVAFIDLDSGTPTSSPAKTPALQNKKAWNPLENKSPTPFRKPDTANAPASPAKTASATEACKSVATASLATKLSPMKANLLPNKPTAVAGYSNAPATSVTSPMKAPLATSLAPAKSAPSASPTKTSSAAVGSKTASPATRTPSTSIYGVIKKTSVKSNSRPTVQSTASAGSLGSSIEVLARAKPAPVSSGLYAGKATVDDTFNGDDSSSGDESRDDDVIVGVPRTPMGREMRGLDTAAVVADDSIGDDGDLDEYADDDAAMDSEDEETEITNTSESMDGSYDNAEEDYEDEEEGAAGNVDDLLDEVLDDDTTLASIPPVSVPQQPAYEVVKRPRERVMPPERPQSEHGLKASLSKSAMKRQSPSHHYDDGGAAKRVTWHNDHVSSSDSDAEQQRAVVYTLDDYRAMVNKKSTTPSAERVIVVRPPDTQHQQQIARQQHGGSSQQQVRARVPESVIRQRQLELQELVNQQQSIIVQTTNALSLCTTNGQFTGSAEQVECHRLLLVACKRRQAYMEEMQRLKAGTSSLMYQRDGCPRGIVSITNIRLPLKHDYLARLGENNSCHYICLVRCGPRLIFTQMLSQNDVVRGNLEVPNLIRLDDIDADFSVVIEVYELLTTTDVSAQQTLRKKKGTGLTPSKRGARGVPSSPAPGGATSVRLSNFVEVGSLTLNMRSLGKTHFQLDHVPLTSLLMGTMQLAVSCVMESAVECRGFLSMFDDVSGFGAWHRRWFSLRNNYLRFWKYPDDETNKQEPIGSIDLKQCITDCVGLVSRDVCARPNTFELVTVRQQQRGEHDTLVTRCYNTVTTIKNWLSADTREDRELWCNKLNEALTSVRKWNADALRPVKQSDLVNAAQSK